MHVAKTLRDIRISAPNRQTAASQKLHYTSFVINEIKSPQDIKIDRQLQAIFNRLNQSYSTSINTPHTAFLKQQIDDFLHLSQTVFLYTKPEGEAKTRLKHPYEDEATFALSPEDVKVSIPINITPHS